MNLFTIPAIDDKSGIIYSMKLGCFSCSFSHGELSGTAGVPVIGCAFTCPLQKRCHFVEVLDEVTPFFTAKMN